MAQMGQISHAGSDGSEPYERIRKAGVYATRTAENVARDLNVISAHTSLMESLFHRQNILDPEVTHGAAGIVRTGKYLYVTQLFIRKLKDVDIHEAKLKLLHAMNDHREKLGILPLSLSDSLNKAAQNHVEVSEKLNSLNPPLLMNQLARQLRGSVRVNVFTASSIEAIPPEIYSNLEVKNQMVGIGFKRVRGKLCESGCYLVTLIFGIPQTD
jgi:hypothetical protein